MRLILKRLICILFLFFPAAVCAQRHLPYLQIFETTETVLLDTQVEFPAINHGIPSSGLPSRGENISFQIFIPRAAGLFAYQCGIALENPNGALTQSFENITVSDWQKNSLKLVPLSTALIYENTNMIFALLPFTGHIATVTMTPRETLQNPLPIKMTCSVTIVSIPPRRVWQMTGPQILHWR